MTTAGAPATTRPRIDGEATASSGVRTANQNRGDSREKRQCRVNPSAIDRRRRALGNSIRGFAASAGISESTYRRMLAGAMPHATTLTRILAALNGKRFEPPRVDILAGLHKGAMAMIAVELGPDARKVLAADFTRQRPREKEWLEAARVRRLAMYVIVVERGCASAAALGRAIGCTKQNVGQALAMIEDWRESDPAIDRLIESIAI